MVTFVSSQDQQLVQTGSTMALAAYGTTPPGSGWVALDAPDLRSRSTSSGFQAQTYINTTTKQVWMAVAGTNDFKDVAAWNAAVTGWNGGASQFKDALDYAAQINNLVTSDPQYAGYSISTSGHSFGQGFAQLFTYTFGWTGVGYDGVGAGAIVGSTGYTQYLASQNITAVGGTNFVACSTSGIGPFGGSVVSLAGSNIAGTRQCTVTLESSTASGIFNIMSTILASNPVLGFVFGKLITGVKLHDMGGIDQAIQNGTFEVAPDSQTVPSGSIVFPRLDPFAIDDGQGNTFSTLLDANGNVVVDGNGNPIFNLEVATQGNAKVVYRVGDNGASVTAPDGSQALFNALSSIGDAVQTYAPPLIDALTLIKAIQSGEPLPIVTSGLRLVNDLNALNHIAPNYALTGAANVGTSIMSLMSLDAALKRGDSVAAITAGAQTLSYGAKAYMDFAVANGGSLPGLDIAKSIDGFFNTGPMIPGLANSTPLPMLNLVNSLAHGDAIGSAMAVLSMNPATAPIATAYYVFELVTSLFGGSDAPPEAWGTAAAHWVGYDAATRATGAYGGLESATATYDTMLAYLDQLVAREQILNPGNPVGIVANRLPSLSYRNYTGYSITDIDPLTGVQNAPGTLYDLNGRPYNAPAGSEQASQSLTERMVRVALGRGAIAPEWEVRTAALQTQAGDPMAGLTEEERAGRAGKLAAALTANDTTQTFRPVALDLNGDGVKTTGAVKTVAINVDGSGYIKSTAWLDNNDAFLFLDRNLNGQMDGGGELFNNGVVALSERGLKGLRWIDSNYDGKLTALDPVWNELQVWQDASTGSAQAGDGKSYTDTNGNGRFDATEPSELKTLAQLGITALNYEMGTYTRNGQVRELSSPDLVADAQGTITYQVSEGIMIETSQGKTSLLVSQVDNLSHLEANKDGVTGREDTENIILGADLLANDTLAGLSGQDLSITGVSGFTHGTGFLDANGNIHYTPDANYFGAAKFNYPLKAANDVVFGMRRAA